MELNRSVSANQNLINTVLSSDWLTVFLTQLKYSRFLVKLEQPNHERLAALLYNQFMMLSLDLHVFDKLLLFIG